MASEIIQFNARIQSGLATDVKVDAVKLNADLGAWQAAAFEKFLSLPIAQRREILRRYPKKAGRKIASIKQKIFPQSYGVKPAKDSKNNPNGTPAGERTAR